MMMPHTTGTMNGRTIWKDHATRSATRPMWMAASTALRTNILSLRVTPESLACYLLLVAWCTHKRSRCTTLLHSAPAAVPDWAQVERRTFSIASRAVSSLIQTQGIGDLYRIYMAAQRDRIDYNLAYIPETFKTPLTKPFDSEYMNQTLQGWLRSWRHRLPLGEATAGVHDP